MKNLFTSMDNLLKPQLIQGSQINESIAYARTKSLLIRTSLSTFTSIAAFLSSFFHPYIEKTLILSLSLQSIENIHDFDAIHHDIDTLLTVIASKIPPRLSLPTLLRCTPNLLAANNPTSIIRYADLLSEVWLNLDRSTVIAQLQELSTIATLLLDYRRLYGDQSLVGISVDKAISDAIIEFCLKLTETELRNFILRLAEWRDMSDITSSIVIAANNNDDKQDEKWRMHSRAVTFYTVIESLNERLKSIFVPCMSIVWSNSVEKLNHFISLGSTSTLDVPKELNKKKNKKRNSGEFLDDSNRDDLVSEFKELCYLSGHILNGVKDCCLNDKEGFIDEVCIFRISYICTSMNV